MRRRIRVIGGITAGALAVTSLAAAAQLDERSKDFRVNSTSPNSRVVNCEAGDEAVAGGFFGDLRESRVIPRTFKLKGERKVLLRSDNIAGGTTGDASVHAYCADRFPDIDKQTKRRRLTPRDDRITARCPGDTRAISGGFKAAPGGPVPVESRRIGDDRWRLRFSLDGRPGRATGFAYCATLLGTITNVRRTETLQSGAIRSVTARCPSGTDLLSGGFRGQNSAGAAKITIVGGSRRAGTKNWRASGQGASSNPSKLSAFAYCHSR